LILDLNECTLGTHNCDTKAICTNTPGSYNCTCKTGYSGNGTYCQGKFFKIELILNLFLIISNYSRYKWMFWSK